jgi:hypothetical protein
MSCINTHESSEFTQIYRDARLEYQRQRIEKHKEFLNRQRETPNFAGMFLYTFTRVLTLNSIYSTR